MNRQTELLLLLGITALGLFLRLYRLDTLPPGDGHDVAQYGVDALQIIGGARPIFLESNFGREPLFSYLVALAFLVVGPGTKGIHLVSTLIGALTIPAVFLSARELFDGQREGAMAYLPLLAAFLAAVSYWHLNWSRVGLRVILVPLFAALIVWALFRGFREGRPSRSRFWFILAGALLGLSLYTYQAARLLPVLVAVGLALRGWLRRRWTREDTINLLVAGGMAVLVFLPLGIYARQHPGALSVRIRQATVVDASLPLAEQARSVAAQALMALSTYSFSGDADPQFTISGRPSLNPFLSLGLFAGCLVALWRFRRSPYLFLLAWLAIMTAPAMVADLAATAKRYLGAFPAVMILAAAGYLIPLEWIRQRTTNDERPTGDGGRPLVILYGLLLAAGLLYSAIRTYRDYFINWAADPDLPTHFQVEHRVIGAAIAGLDTAQTVWLSPYPPDQPVIQLHAGLRPDLRGYNGRFCVPYADPIGENGAAYVIVPGLQDASLAELQRLFPDGQTTAGPLRPGGDRPYYNILSVPPGVSPAFGPGVPASANWEGEIELLGFDLDRETVAPGESLTLTLTYRALARPGDYTAFVHLLGPPQPDGSPVWAQSDSAPCGGALPTSRWQVGDVIRDTLTLSIPGDTPAGEYELSTGFYTWPDLIRLRDDATGLDAVDLTVVIRIERP
jgi:4-amino-4-deoxy-L-arabinose transferase-like glycosyltransferase